MLSNKEIICPNNLINVAKKSGPVDAAIVNAGEIFPMESVHKAVEHKLINPIFIGNQDEINKSGGIYGKSVDLSCGFCHGNVDEVSDQIIDYLKQDDYSVVISSGGQKRYDKIVETLNAENFLFFSVVNIVF